MATVVMTDCVVDAQYFPIQGDIVSKWAVKELATYNGTMSYHYIFKPLFPFHHLSEPLKRQARWVTNHHHGLVWDGGDEALDDLPRGLHHITKDSDIIYVKGKEKAKFVKNFINKPVVELLEQPKLEATVPQCFHHHNKCACALSNVYNLYKCFIDNIWRLAWDGGDEALDDLPRLLHHVTKDSDIIYVKGKEKAQLIRSYLKNKPVVELLEHPKLQKTQPECFHHSRNRCASALANVYSLYQCFIKA